MQDFQRGIGYILVEYLSVSSLKEMSVFSICFSCFSHSAVRNELSQHKSNGGITVILSMVCEGQW